MASAVAANQTAAVHRPQRACSRPATACARRPAAAAAPAHRPPALARPEQRRRGVAVRAVDVVAEGLSVEEFETLVAAEPAMLVDFYTTWCGPCKVLDVSMKAIEPSYQGKCAFRKVDAQQNYKLAQHFNVSKLPTLLVFRGGVQVDRYEGVLSAQDLDMRLRGLLAGSAPNPNSN